MFKKIEALVAVIALTAIATINANAASTVLVQTGNFTQDDDVVLINVDILADGGYRFESFGYAGGTLSDGSVVSSGGFDTMFNLFDASGAWLNGNDDGTNRVDANTGSSYDAGFSQFLTAGMYTLAVTQYDNDSLGDLLSDGFERSGEGNFTPTLEGDCLASAFCDVSGVSPENERTSFYAVDISAVPVPGALVLLAPALLACVKRRRDA